MSRTIEGITTAWLTTHSDPRVLNEDGCVAEVSYSNLDMSDMEWTRIGVATISIEVEDENRIVQDKIESLRKKQRDVLAAAHATSTRIDAAIQSLLAIGLDAVVADVAEQAVSDDIPF